MPHYLVVEGRQRTWERVHQEILQSHGATQDIAKDDESSDHIEDEDMNETICNFFEGHVPPIEEGNNEGDETPLQKATKTPLYDGSQYSVLRICLDLLNLQRVYGWSNASVTSLLK